MAATVREWIDLVDPSRGRAAREAAARASHATALRALLAPHVHDDEPRPRVESHGDVHPRHLPRPGRRPRRGSRLLPGDRLRRDARRARHGLEDAAGRAAVRPEAREGGVPPRRPRRACSSTTSSTSIAESYLDLVDDLDDEIDELEDMVGAEPGEESRTTPARAPPRPARDPPHAHADPRRGAQDRRRPRRARRRGELFPRDVEIAFGDAYDKLLRATEALESSRDSLGGRPRLPAGQDRERPERGR